MSKIQFDYESIKNRVVKNLSKQEGWEESMAYSAVDSIISAFAEELGIDMNGIEAYSYENFWSKARNKSSLLVMSPMHGYKPHRKQGSEGTIRISTSETFDSSNGKNVIIPKFSQFSGAGYYFCNDSDKTLNGKEPFVDINVIEGERIDVNFVAQGDTYEEKEIVSESVENQLFRVTVNDIEWTVVDSLYECDSEAQCYEVNLSPNCKSVIVRFGNGFYGQKLNKGDVVKITYLETHGKECYIEKENVSTVETQLYDSDGKPLVCFCKNVTAIKGGKDYPTIEEIRLNSPRVYQTGDRASNEDDYAAVINDLTSISKIIVYGAFEKLKDEGKSLFTFIPSEENVVHIGALDGDFKPLSDSTKNSLIERIHKINDPTDLIVFEDVNTIPFKVTVKAVVKSTAYSLSEVKSNINDRFDEIYKIQNRDFNQAIYDSDLVSLADGSEGINYCKVTVTPFIKGDLKNANTFKFDIPYDNFNIEKTYVYIRNKSVNGDWTNVGYCDENGNILPSDTNNIVTGSINVTTHEGSCEFESPLLDFENYEFKVESFAEMPKDKSKIWYLGETDISVSYPED